MLKTKIISSLSRVFVDSSIDDFTPLEKMSALKGERVSFQLVHSRVMEPGESIYAYRELFTPKFSGALAKYVTVREVQNVGVELPIIVGDSDEYYERTTPGLYPDVLRPLHYGGKTIAKTLFPTSLWIDVTIPADASEVGVSELKIEMMDEGGASKSEDVLKIDLINATLPEQELILTQWFHCDCLAQYYDVEVWSEKHWQIVENFARVARKNGINLLLTPTFTPPLDTMIGGERLTNQLVVVEVKDGKYSFNFDLLDRWVDMCDRIGIKYFEIAHLFTQWGAKHAPKVMATVDGEYKKIFGWETDACSEEYITFLRTFITELLAHMKKSGNDKRCFFHISDEPQLEHLESYSNAKKAVEDLLDGYVIMDALSDYDFWKMGIVNVPIPCNDHIKTFIENNVPNLWTYYCCGQRVNVSNRLLSMPSWRNRSIGMQMYKYDIVGFLQWGYNFYNNQFSVDPVEPFTDSCGEHWVPAGDTYSVYPAPRGNVYESIRIVVFHEALQDISAMKLCESLYSKEEVVAEIEKILGETLAFDVCAKSEDTMLKIRAKINEMIKAKI
jgi:hypothetical protein